MRLIYLSAIQVDTAVLFSTAITLAAFVPLFTMQGVEGQIFSPMARTYGYALIGALLATFTITPVLASFLLPEHVAETETLVVRTIRAAYPRAQAGTSLPAGDRPARHRFPCPERAFGHQAWNGVPPGAGGGQPLDPGLHAADHLARSRHAHRGPDARDPEVSSGSDHRGVAAWPPR